jgi:hypothetical protein
MSVSSKPTTRRTPSASTQHTQSTPSAKTTVSTAAQTSKPNLVLPKYPSKTEETKMVQANPFGNSNQPSGLSTVPKGQSQNGQIERGRPSSGGAKTTLTSSGGASREWDPLISKKSGSVNGQIGQAVDKTASLRSAAGKAGTDAVQTNANQLETKHLTNESRVGEKDQPLRTVVTSEGKQVHVRDKKWQQHSTQYFGKEQRAASEVGFQETPGRVLQPSPNPKAPTTTPVKNAVLTQGGKELGPYQEHIFAMDKKGQIYSSDKPTSTDPSRTIQLEGNRRADVHHSSFLKGKGVAGAGELKTARDGTLGTLTDRSGHYEPTPKQTLQTMNELEKKGVNLQNTKFEMHRGPNVTTGMAEEFRQGAGSESLFKARHAVADQIKANGAGVRNTLNSAADTRALDVALKTTQSTPVANTVQSTPVRKKRNYG